jgi:hypothetical protein
MKCPICDIDNEIIKDMIFNNNDDVIIQLKYFCDCGFSHQTNETFFCSYKEKGWYTTGKYTLVEDDDCK